MKRHACQLYAILPPEIPLAQHLEKDVESLKSEKYRNYAFTP